MNPFEQIPPHDSDAEAGVLGAAMCDPRAFGLAYELLTDDDFYIHKHGVLFSMMATLGPSVDLIRLKSTLEVASRLEEAGGWDYIQDLIVRTPTAANIELYCRIVKDRAVERKLLEGAARIVKLVKDPGDGLPVATQAEAIIKEAANYGLPPYASNGLKQIDEQLEDERTGKRFAVEWPKFPSLSRTKALLPNSVTAIVGSPGASKSLFILECMWRWHVQAIPSAILMLEKGIEFHMRRAFAQLAEDSRLTDDRFTRFNADLVQKHMAEQREKLADLERVGLIHAPHDHESVTVDYLLTWLKRQLDDGKRILGVDPVTIIDTSPQLWEDHKRFVREAGRLVKQYKASLICVTHPKSTPGRLVPCLENMSCGKAWQNFTDTVIWLEAHGERESMVKKQHVTELVKYNRTIHLLKTRLGTGAGKRIGVEFDVKKLWHFEQGEIQED